MKLIKFITLMIIVTNVAADIICPQVYTSNVTITNKIPGYDKI